MQDARKGQTSRVVTLEVCRAVVMYVEDEICYLPNNL